MLDNLIELAIELVPVTVKSLQNSFDKDNYVTTSGRYGEYGIFLANSKMGAYITGFINNVETTVYFIKVPYVHKKEHMQSDDQVIIVCIANKDSKGMWRKPFVNKRYCLAIGDFEQDNKIIVDKYIEGA